MAKILILSLVFPPDNVSTAQLMGELAVDMQRLGHEVCVITTVPHYNCGTEALVAQPLRRWLWSVVKRSSFEGISVYHVWVPQKGKNLVVRAMGWGLFHFVSTLLGLVIPFRAKVLLAPSPPITIGVSAWLVGLFRRMKYIYNVQEIYPDVAIHLGLIRSPILIYLLYRIERFVYQRAVALTTISAGMRQRIMDKGVGSEKVRLIPNFVDISTFECLQKGNDFGNKYGLTDKFVISYAGNMGKPQALDVFVRAFGLLSDLPQVHLLMVGSGSEYDRLCSLARMQNMNNVTFLPQQPYSMVPLLYATSDLSIVSQSIGTYLDGIPSKVYRIMGSGRAVLAHTREDSDLGMLVREARAGLIMQSNDPVVIAAQIREAAQRPGDWVIAGESGRAFVASRFSRQLISNQYSELVAEVARGLT